MATMKIQLNIAGIRELRKSGGVQADLSRRAHAIAARADSSLSKPGHEVTTSIGATRARATVTTETNEAKAAEGSRRNLSFAINAGKG